MAIADSYDAMTTTRPYRVPLLEVAVLRELSDNRGRQFDPYLVDSFLKLDVTGPRDRASGQQICQQQT